MQVCTRTSGKTTRTAWLVHDTKPEFGALVLLDHRADHAVSQNLLQNIVRDDGFLASDHDAAHSFASNAQTRNLG